MRSMAARMFNLIEGSLYRSPLRLVEAMYGEQKRSWDLGYHHAIRGHAPSPDAADDRDSYMKGYSGVKQKGLKHRPYDPQYHTDVDEPKDHLRTPGQANSPSYQLGQNIKNGLGMRPGDFSHVMYQINNDDSVKYDKERASHEAAALSKPLQEHGQAFISSDPELSHLWSTAMRSREEHESPDADLQGYADRQQAASAIVEKLCMLGRASIPEEHYEARKSGFQRSFVRKVEGPDGEALSRDYLDRAARYSAELFDAFGPAAEATLQRVIGKSTMQPLNSQERPHFDETNGEITWDDKEALFHEFGHAMDTLFHGADTDETGYWSSRVQGKDRSPSVHYGFDDDDGEEEMVKEDNWAEPYMGKVYSQISEWDHEEQVGSHSEVLPVFLEGLSNADAGGKWAKQIKKDPQAVLEVIGYLRASIDGVKEAGWGGG